MLVLDDRPDRVHVPAHPGELSSHEQARAAVRLIRTVDGVKREARCQFTGYDSSQRVWPADAVEIYSLEVLLRGRTEGLNAGALVRIRQAHAFQRALDRIAGRKRESSLRLAEVL